MMKNQEFHSSLNPSVATVALILLLVSVAPAATEKILHNFNVLPHGANPESNLIADAAGNLYGTSSRGGGYGVVFKLTPTSGGKWVETVIHDFVGEPGSGPDGAYPAASLIFDAAGNLYGTTSEGGIYGQGTVFKLTPVSGGKWIESVIHQFAGYPSDGTDPVASLIFDNAGNLYGTTANGGNNDGCGDQYQAIACGTVFELSPSSGGTWTEAVLYNFQGASDGCTPLANVVIDAAGNLYGSTPYCGGEEDQGTIFELSRGSGGSWTQSVIYDFNNTDAFNPSGVIFDEAGNLYGTAGSYYGKGTASIAFELTPGEDVWTETTLYVFTGGADGGNPSGNLTFDSAGNLYGTAQSGGISSACNNQGCGTVFELSAGSGGWTEKVLYSFTGQSDGSDPKGGVLRVSADTLYTTASWGATAGCSGNGTSGCGAVLKLTASAGGDWKAAPIYDFPSPQDGSTPYSNLVSDASGNLFGTTESGGTAPCECGTVFELSPTSTGEWKEKILYSFTGTNGDGYGPLGGVIFDQSGNLYGTTPSGGNQTCDGNVPCGTVFELSPSRKGGWTETVIYKFNSSDSFEPMAGLVIDEQGNLYGTTTQIGNVFQLVHTLGIGWQENTLYTVGGYVKGSLVLDEQGNLYGTTWGGGSSQQGAVFKVSRSGNMWTGSILYSFNRADGWWPDSSLIFDHEGNLYGTTSEGGVYDAGVVFKLTHALGDVWTETVLHNFMGVNGDGAIPTSNLIFDGSGNLYGTTTLGGTNGGGCGGVGCGTAFELIPSADGKWKERVLHRFTGGSDGGQPQAGFIFDTSGNLYSTTSSGGNAAEGTVFEIKP
jgi:uncharacterized repeat protein (TIGR03803 family)